MCFCTFQRCLLHLCFCSIFSLFIMFTFMIQKVGGNVVL
uniref:Uncharacterized protein n=1 Tax=Anguilla anguilla TaxID=7936 RepID=A0A0E9XWR9_ANGAN